MPTVNKISPCLWFADLFKDENSAKAARVMEAMLPMKKLDIAKLKKAAAG